MKKAISLLLALVMCLSLGACGGENDTIGTSNDSENIATGDGWYVDKNGVLVISDMEMNKIPNYSYSSPAPWHPYRMLINSIKIEEGITHIGELAFHSCEKAKDVQFPSTLEQIADKAFTFCLSLTSITLPDSVNYVGMQVFEGCTALETVTWSKSAFSVGDKTFTGCTALKNIELPEGVAYIHRRVFENCTALATITLPNSLKTFENDSFEGCSALIIKCQKNTGAEEMAIEHNMPYELIDTE